MSKEMKKIDTSEKRVETIDVYIPELESAPDHIVRNKPWTSHEEAVLKKYYGRKEIDAISKYLKRSRQSVLQKAQHMGLKLVQE